MNGGWFEEYSCGCVSAIVTSKRDLLGYCGTHGDSRRRVHKIPPTTIRKTGLKLRKQPVAAYNPQSWQREPGERVFFRRCPGGPAEMYDLFESRGRNMRDTGMLTYRVVKKNGHPRLAVQGQDGLWYWRD